MLVIEQFAMLGGVVSTISCTPSPNREQVGRERLPIPLTLYALEALAERFDDGLGLALPGKARQRLDSRMRDRGAVK